MEKRSLIRSFVLGCSGLLVGLSGAAFVQAQPKPAPVAAPAPAPAPTNCKAYGASKCCDPAVTAHLSKEAVFSVCGQSEATYLGEAAQKDTCKYMFKIGAEKEEQTFVQVYAPAAKEVPDEPNDPFFHWKKVGKAYVTNKAASPKSAPILERATGIWVPGKGYIVSVNASVKVCTKAKAMKLAARVR